MRPQIDTACGIAGWPQLPGAMMAVGCNPGTAVWTGVTHHITGRGHSLCNPIKNYYNTCQYLSQYFPTMPPGYADTCGEPISGLITLHWTSKHPFTALNWTYWALQGQAKQRTAQGQTMTRDSLQFTRDLSLIVELKQKVWFYFCLNCNKNYQYLILHITM